MFTNTKRSRRMNSLIPLGRKPKEETRESPRRRARRRWAMVERRLSDGSFCTNLCTFAVFSCEPVAFRTRCRRPTCRSHQVEFQCILRMLIHSWVCFRKKKKKTRKKTQTNERRYRLSLRLTVWGRVAAVHSDRRPYGAACTFPSPGYFLFPASQTSPWLCRILSYILWSFIVVSSALGFCQVYLRNLLSNKWINQLLIN